MSQMPDWMMPVDQMQEAFDYEMNAEYDRFDGHREDAAFDCTDPEDYVDERTDEEKAQWEAELAEITRENELHAAALKNDIHYKVDENGLPF